MNLSSSGPRNLFIIAWRAFSWMCLCPSRQADSLETSCEGTVSNILGEHKHKVRRSHLDLWNIISYPFFFSALHSQLESSGSHNL